MVRALSSCGTSDIDILKYATPDYPDALGLSGKQDFGTDEQVQTAAQIPQRVYYVKGTVQKEDGDGSSWQSAFADLQTAIAAAGKAGGGEIWVAQGTYRPTSDGNRRQSFVLRRGIALYGGFAGTESELAQRDWEHNPTILTGKIANEVSGNSYHVVIGAKGAILDGFIVRDGNADGRQKDGFGGGMLNWGHDASVIVRNTLFTNNYARDGGAIFNFGDVLAYFRSVKIIGNSADMGGGISARFGSSLRMEQSVIEGNRAAYRGGGAVVNYGSNAEFIDVAFSDNHTDGNGGGAFVDDQASQYGKTQPKFLRCRFSGNSAGFFGGALHNFNSATTILEHNSFSGNQAKYGADIANTLNARVTIRGDLGDDSGVVTDATSMLVSDNTR
ncbi:right-handed parallel beta-helix repeat-containing protein [uncultured Thiodictyon sp.]|uniref:right-handed parallel beta-helix repeat-containing protein n=1 Tax=uncultured Thiodictyon sp. TaxID=1846217 RepID=UPI0025E8D314|nr:right-handed parallel beta-helix repeat-containing protein [uncultured Thiodictyon sp.]